MTLCMPYPNNAITRLENDKHDSCNRTPDLPDARPALHLFGHHVRCHYYMHCEGSTRFSAHNYQHPDHMTIVRASVADQHV